MHEWSQRTTVAERIERWLMPGVLYALLSFQHVLTANTWRCLVFAINVTYSVEKIIGPAKGQLPFHRTEFQHLFKDAIRATDRTSIK